MNSKYARPGRRACIGGFGRIGKVRGKGRLEELPRFEQHSTSETSSHHRGFDVPSIWHAQKLEFL